MKDTWRRNGPRHQMAGGHEAKTRDEAGTRPRSGGTGRFAAALKERLASDGVVHVDFPRLRDRLRADIEMALNARRPAVPLPPALPELQRSLLAFGLADSSGGPGLDAADSEGFRRQVELCLPTLLPQLMSVCVEVADTDNRGDESDICIRLRISAVISVAQGPQALTFDTRYSVDTGRFEVEGAGDD
ncbi:type VI secretion system baseplate subunit TssE [Chelatococcus asaccharovorans]|uniref:Putative component of type VI protein secretion system n=1 Tax=Chelatococcus asaccharovorans TaxID=28210 RepID=A0A2V3UHQ4_9HYPH|nr:hypothetical protein [Chelatococcus asaccharovorans]MBS7706455.1 hypothetical protein [Chelatococcus asaccharovorans]PXW64902.1 putative component of type VI protein secretion system [Chelatococcus asaccharovorans]